jgi:N-acetylglutamate synthase-like GNAT family acetyltransferase
MDRLTVRLATLADVPGIADVLRDSFEEYRDQYTPAALDATTPSVDALAARMEEGPTWVVEIDGEIVGTVSCRITEGDCYVRSMAVRPVARGRGVSRRLLNTVELWAEDSGCAVLTLETTRFLAEAIGLYSSAGYCFTGAERDLFGTPVVAMNKHLVKRRS